MKELNENEISMIAGSSAESCRADIFGSTGMGMAIGSAVGAAVGAPGGPLGIAAGGFLGGMLGGALGGGATASVSPSCRGPEPMQQN